MKVMIDVTKKKRPFKRGDIVRIITPNYQRTHNCIGIVVVDRHPYGADWHIVLVGTVRYSCSENSMLLL